MMDYIISNVGLTCLSPFLGLFLIVVIANLIDKRNKRKCRKGGGHDWVTIPETTRERPGRIHLQTRKEECSKCKIESIVKISVTLSSDKFSFNRTILKSK